MTRKRKLAVVSAILTGVAGLASALDMVGQVASPAGVLTVFFAGVAAGASVVVARVGARNGPSEIAAAGE